jgi:hypothetical protein
VQQLKSILLVSRRLQALEYTELEFVHSATVRLDDLARICQQTDAFRATLFCRWLNGGFALDVRDYSFIGQFAVVDWHVQGVFVLFVTLVPYLSTCSSAEL